MLINGSPSKPFKMERGLRQGNPLSPFLFVLVVDVLHRMVGEAVRNGRISPLLVGSDNIELSHLQFADDTILFCPQKMETLVNYKRLLRCFELMSGLSINFDKSSLISVNCANSRLVKIWKPIIDKVEDKLSLWKAKSLNKADKLVLIKSVLNSLPVYYLSLYKMPKAVAERIIGLQRRFLWSIEDGNNGIPLEDCPLWKKVVCSYNQLNPSVMLSKQPLPSRGGPWKDICQLNIREQEVRDMMISGLSMELRNGRSIRFWQDDWLQSGSLKDSFPRLFSISNQQGSVIGDCGLWDGLE
ncbi:uncharacterized protein [Arachis hypogaea]|uniref:uncharacterized protein n=1 Tax=Arachis hypogaea TaxID=3818 RepID=UPI003B221E04